MVQQLIRLTVKENGRRIVLVGYMYFWLWLRKTEREREDRILNINHMED